MPSIATFPSQNLHKISQAFECGDTACCHYLSDEAHYRKIAKSFGIAKSTVCSVIRCTTHAIPHFLGPKYIKMPSTEEEVVESVTQFYSTFCFPQCLGAVDSTHIDTKQHKVLLETMLIESPGIA